MAKAIKYSDGYTTTYIPSGFKLPTKEDINKIIGNKPVITDTISQPEQKIDKVNDVSTSHVPVENYLDNDLKEPGKIK